MLKFLLSAFVELLVLLMIAVGMYVLLTLLTPSFAKIITYISTGSFN